VPRFIYWLTPPLISSFSWDSFQAISMANSDQLEEMEVLSSMYPDEFSPVSGKLTGFKIRLFPNSGDVDHGMPIYLTYILRQIFRVLHETVVSLCCVVAVNLVCTLPSEYPVSVSPIFNIEIIKGLSEIHVDELKSVADRIAQENVGSCCVFAVTEAIKEWLIDNNTSGLDGSMYSGKFFITL
jgi:hypothetical protein